MVTFNDTAADAAEAQQALRGPAHATRSIDDPRQVYAILGSLSAAAASLDHARGVEATIAYDHRDFSALSDAPHATLSHGLSL